MANPLRKTMVYLGLAEDDYDDVAPVAPVAPVGQPAPARAPVTPLRRPSKHAAPAMNEIATLVPRGFGEAPAIGEAFREGVPVIMNLSHLTDTEARRVIDFASGLAVGLYGKLERVAGKVYLLSPEHVAVSGEPAEPESGVDAGFFGD